ncbi:hypothetical protein [Streptomyces sp. NPDC091209]
MTTDFQQAREALGRRLRELRGDRTQRDAQPLSSITAMRPK